MFPAIAVARELLVRQPVARIVFAGSERAVDHGILGRESFDLRRLPAASSADLRRNPATFLRTNWRAWRSARKLIEELSPEAVIGCGGYASVAPLLAARRAEIATILLEQNVIPGRATTWLARGADRICLSFEETRARLPRRADCIVTGNPVRAEIVRLSRIRERDAGPRKLLVLGGSQGAHSLNELMLAFAADRSGALSDWSILHQTGTADHESVAARYAERAMPATAAPFIDDMAAEYRAASAVVTRAGATTLAELSCTGLPALLVPHRHAVRDHQRINAEFYARHGAAVVLTETGDPATDAAAFSQALASLLDDDSRRASMSTAMRRLARPDAAQAVCDVIASVTTGPD